MTYVVYYKYLGQFWTEDYTDDEFSSLFGDGDMVKEVNASWMMV